MSVVEIKKTNLQRLLFLSIFGIMLTVFILTNNGHRYTIDEDFAQKQAMYIVTDKPGPLYVAGNSTILYEYPQYFPHPRLPACQSAILCSPANIGHSITEVPFVLANNYFHFVNENTATFSSNDFNDPAYIYWRNSLDPDFTFLQLLYNPLFGALSVGVFFLVCRTFSFSNKTSTMLSFMLGFCTLMWPYSKTSLNVIPDLFFILLGFLFFRKYQVQKSYADLLLSGSSLGFAFLVRNDAVLIIVPLFAYLIIDLMRQNRRVGKFFSFVIPTIISYVIYFVVNSLRYGGSSRTQNVSSPTNLIPLSSSLSNFLQGLFGLLFSPGVGLFVFTPVLVTIFFTFPDFYSKNKRECLLFIAFIVEFLLFFAAGGGGWWHGLIAWGPRYLVPITPFLLLPLGSSIEKRKNKVLKISIISLACLGFFFNLVYVVQDVSWFVWGNASLHTGLFGIEKNGLYDLNIHPATIWTFQFSQLTQSMITAFTHLQPDIYLFKVLTPQAFSAVFFIVLIPQIYFLFKLLKSNTMAEIHNN